VKVDLPSGQSAEIRTALKARDKFAVQSAISGSNQDGSALSLMETALIARLLESWTLEEDLPSRHTCAECTTNAITRHEHIRDLFGEIMDLDDYNALEKVIAPMLAKVVDTPNLETSPGSAASS
jgi:hypothetical protein